MYLGKAIQDFTPPILIKMVKLIRRLQKTYKSYNEALSACTNSLGYEDPEFVKMIFEETEEYILSLNENYSVFADQTIINTLIPLSFITNTETLNIIDIGGSFGMHYYPIKKILGDKYKFNWSIVETKALSEKAKELENEELKFYNNLNEAANNFKKIDLIISSGSIQYFEDPRKILTEMINSGADYILLTRLSLTLSDCDIISVQKSLLSQNSFEKLPVGYSDKTIMYPHTNMKEVDFKNIIETKYKIKLYFDDKSGVQKINNHKIVGYGLLLEKKIQYL